MSLRIGRMKKLPGCLSVHSMYHFEHTQVDMETDAGKQAPRKPGMVTSFQVFSGRARWRAPARQEGRCRVGLLAFGGRRWERRNLECGGLVDDLDLGRQ